MKYKLLVFAALLMASAALIFANGQQEHMSLSGKVVSVTNVSGGNVTVTVTSNGKTYSATVPQTALNGLNIAVGKVITVKGVEHSNSDGTSTIEADSIAEDGVNHDIHIAKDNSHDSGKSVESEKSSGDSSSHDSETHSSGDS